MATSGRDRIHIRDLRAYCVVGIFPHERETKQEVNINITLYTDLSRAAQTDNINDTIDYKKLKKRVLELVEPSGYQLIETMAADIASICLDDPRVERCTVSVDKPGALSYARSVAVEIDRGRD